MRPLLAIFALALAACQSTEDPQPRPRPLAPVQSGPLTAYADVGLYGENPLQAFQRTGNQPLPLSTLPLGTPLRILSQSGSFYEVSTPDMQTGWVPARSVTGVTSYVPEWTQSTETVGSPNVGIPTPSVNPQNGIPNMPSGTEPDTIDLDKMP